MRKDLGISNDKYVCLFKCSTNGNITIAFTKKIYCSVNSGGISSEIADVEN